MATDKEIFGDDPTERIPTGGRPAVDRDKALRLFKAGQWTTAQIARALMCSKKTIQRIRAELEAEGKLGENGDPMKGLKIGGAIEADFDSECFQATGFSFKDWLKSRFTDPNRGTVYFNFARRVWVTVWDKPSLVRAADRDDPTGDQLCISFLNAFSDDEKRMRDRKKRIRFLFRFLGRGDLNDRHLTMTRSKDPLAVREVPEISLTAFPAKFDACINAMGDIKPKWATMIRAKLVFMARTGEVARRRGIYGLTRQGSDRSWIVMEAKDDGTIEYRGQILDKGRINWTIGYLPPTVKKELFEVYKATPQGEPLFDASDSTELNLAWGKITKKMIGRTFKLHDLRKVSATWYYALRVPLEILCQINVGWKDLNTPKEHYLQLRGLLKKSERDAYAANIPTWFKEEIAEFTES